MTDINQASELYELCKEVYEKTGWEDVRDFYHENDTFDEETQTFKRNGIFSIVERKRADYNTPLYTSDYLLEKLPKEQFTQPDFVECLMVRKDSETSYTAGYFLIIEAKADTPLKALLKLTISLSEAGELNG